MSITDRGPGGVATAGRPPRPRRSLARGTRRVVWYPVQNVKNIKYGNYAISKTYPKKLSQAADEIFRVAACPL